jgi:1A family penicillin-binding protein
MQRQGKYTKRVTPSQHVKRGLKKRFRWWRQLSWKKRILFVGGPILAFLILTPLLTYLYFARDISDMDRLMNRNNTGIVLYANDGKTEIYSEGRAEHRDLLPLDQISPMMRNALIASEDKNFYTHSGFSIPNMVAALYRDFVTGNADYGGSTLTQQLAKNTLLSDNKNFLRKFQELSIAIAIERTYTKDQILDMYLNSVYYGENAFGIQDAAKTYFGTTPDKLDLAQSAMLVGVLPAPSAYSPISGSVEYANERQNTVLTRMVTNGYITNAQKTAAQAEKLTYQPEQSPINSSIAPHFAQMVLSELYQKYGEETVTRSGYQVTTTLDANVQNQMAAAVAGNMRTINAYGGHNAAGVAIDPTNGEIRGLVGSYDWSNTEFGKVNIVTSQRQPGSSFKPIYYSQALASGTITPATVLQDVKTDFGGGYVPLDADRKFRGDVTVRSALDMSLNIPSVEVMQKYGIDNAVSAAQKMGITSIDSKNNYGLSLALGSAEVTPLQMTNAYAAFANQGTQYNNTTIKTIQSKYNEQVFKANESSHEVISPQGAYLISNILADNTARAPIFGNSLTVYDGKTRAVKSVAVKTGTTNDDRDAWAIGYTPQLAMGIWVGNNDNTPMTNGGSIMAGPIFTKAMGNILAGVDTSFKAVSGVVQKNICTSNHGIADSAVRGQTYTEWFLETALPNVKCGATETPSPTPTPTPSTTPTDNKNESLSLSLSASPSGSAPQGSNVTFTASLSDSSSHGFVTFKDGNTTIGTSAVIGGSASIITPLLSQGNHTITATFNPNDPSVDSVSDSINYQITNANKKNGSLF